MKKNVYQNIEKMNRIKYLFKNRRHTEALKEVDEYILEYPSEGYAYVFKGMILSFSAKYDEAEKIFFDILSHNPEDNIKYFVYEQLAALASKKGEKEKAVSYLEEVVFNSNLVCLKARRELSILYYDFGRVDESVNILNVDGFNDENLNYARAYVYYKKGMLGDALRAIDAPCYNDGRSECAKIYETDDIKNKTHAQILFLKGTIYARQKKYKESIDIYKEGLKCTNNSKKIYYDILSQLAASYYKIGEHTKAIDICNNIINNQIVNDKIESIYVLLGNCYIKLGNKTQFIKVINNCRDFEIKSLLEAQLLVSEFKFEDALAKLRLCDSKSYAALFYKLIILYRLNRYEDFMRVLELFKQNKDYIENRKSAVEVDRMRLYMEYDRGITDITTLSYSDNQYKNYSVEEAINHIRTRHLKYGDETEFAINTNISSLYEYVINKLSEFDVICDGLYDEYYVKIDASYLNGLGEQIKYICVICIPNTTKIITMYPVNNYVSEKENYMPKVKQKEKLSRSDKFKLKYGL